MTRLICGFLALDGACGAGERVSAMLGAMTAPGLRATSACRDEGPVALGVLDLAPDDGVQAAAPGILPVEGGWLAADAQLYPREGRPHPDGAPDETLVRALSAGGHDAAAELHGDFAYARWDATSRRLTLARDHFGVRPLTWCLRPGQYFAFASIVPALLDTGLAGHDLDDESPVCFLSNYDAPAGRTFFREIAELSPAHRLEIGLDGRPVISRYWRLDTSRRLPLDSDPVSVAAELRRLLDQAVRRRLPGRGPVAGDLSGGLDSGAIAVLAARALAPDGRRYIGLARVEAARPGGPRFVDERPMIETTASAEPNIELESIAWPAALSPAYFDVLPGGPYPAFPAEIVNASLRRAARRGARCVLSGWGGNEAVTWRGANVHAELFWRGRWRLLARLLAADARSGGASRARLFAGRVLLQSLPPDLRERVRHWIGRPRYAAAYASVPFIAAHRRHQVRVSVPRDHVDSGAIRRANLENPWLGKRMAQEAGRAALHGLSCRYPMLDRDLIDFAVRIPGHLFRRDGVSRAIFREAMAGVLPDRVRLDEGRVTSFPCHWLRDVEGKAVILDELARAEASPLVREFIDVEAARRHVASWPAAEEIRRRIEASADGADEALWPDEDIELVLLLARFLRDREAAAAPRAGPRQATGTPRPHVHAAGAGGG